MADFNLKRSNLLPVVQMQLFDPDGDTADLQGATVKFIMRRRDLSGAPLVKTGSIVDAANGKVRYDWQVGDTDEAGLFSAEWEVTFSNGKKITYPNGSHIEIEILDALSTGTAATAGDDPDPLLAPIDPEYLVKTDTPDLPNRKVLVPGDGIVATEDVDGFWTWRTDGGGANWTGTRYFAVDYDGGDDANDGYSDTSLEEAGAVAVKTIERLLEIFPRLGNGRAFSIGIKPRANGATYLKQDGITADTLTADLYGYARGRIRGTADFSDDAADKVICGGRAVSGTNGSGYNPTGTPTTTVISCQQVGGAAAALSAEPALLSKRIRFAANTATVALRNKCACITANTSSQVTLPSGALPTAPTTSDVFTIEEPGAVLGSVHLGIWGADTELGLESVQVVGIKTTGTFDMHGPGTGQAAFIDAVGSFSIDGLADFIGRANWDDPDFNTWEVGPSFHAGSAVFYNVATIRQLSYFACSGFLLQGTSKYYNIDGYVRGFDVAYSALSIYDCMVTGNDSSIGGRVVNGGVSVNHSRGGLSGLSSEGQIVIENQDLEFELSDVTGTIAAESAIDLSASRFAKIRIGSGVTIVGTNAAKAIKMADSVFYAHADYTRSNLRDFADNVIVGSGVPPVDVITYQSAVPTSVGQYRIVDTNGNAARANAACHVLGTVQNAALAAGSKAVIACGGGVLTQFDAAPTVGGLAYLSAATAGVATQTVPSGGSTDQTLPLGRVIAALSGNIGLVAWEPDHTSNLTSGGGGTASQGPRAIIPADFDDYVDEALTELGLTEDQVDIFFDDFKAGSNWTITGSTSGAKLLPSRLRFAAGSSLNEAVFKISTEAVEIFHNSPFNKIYVAGRFRSNLSPNATMTMLAGLKSLSNAQIVVGIYGPTSATKFSSYAFQGSGSVRSALSTINADTGWHYFRIAIVANTGWKFGIDLEALVTQTYGAVDLSTLGLGPYLNAGSSSGSGAYDAEFDKFMYVVPRP